MSEAETKSNYACPWLVNKDTGQIRKDAICQCDSSWSPRNHSFVPSKDFPDWCAADGPYEHDLIGYNSFSVQRRCGHPRDAHRE